MDHKASNCMDKRQFVEGETRTFCTGVPLHHIRTCSNASTSVRCMPASTRQVSNCITGTCLCSVSRECSNDRTSSLVEMRKSITLCLLNPITICLFVCIKTKLPHMCKEWYCLGQCIPSVNKDGAFDCC